MASTQASMRSGVMNQACNTLEAKMIRARASREVQLRSYTSHLRRKNRTTRVDIGRSKQTPNAALSSMPSRSTRSTNRNLITRAILTVNWCSQRLQRVARHVR